MTKLDREICRNLGIQFSNSDSEIVEEAFRDLGIKASCKNKLHKFHLK